MRDSNPSECHGKNKSAENTCVNTFANSDKPNVSRRSGASQVSDTDLTWFQENWPMLSTDDQEAVREHVDHLIAFRVTGGVR